MMHAYAVPQSRKVLAFKRLALENASVRLHGTSHL